MDNSYWSMHVMHLSSANWNLLNNEMKSTQTFVTMFNQTLLIFRMELGTEKA